MCNVYGNTHCRAVALKILPIPKMKMFMRYVREFNERSQAAAMVTATSDPEEEKDG